MHGHRSVRSFGRLKGSGALVVSGAVLSTMLGSSPSWAEPSVPSDAPSAVADVPTDVPSDVPTAVPSDVPTSAPVDPTDTGTNPSADTPTSNPVSTAGSTVMNTGNWSGNWASGDTPAPPVPAVLTASAVIPTGPTSSPAVQAVAQHQVGAIAQKQISASPTKPQLVTTKALGTAGGLVQAKVTTVPDAAEVAAGVTKAGTKLVISSDASKLSPADYQAMLAKAPNLTRALFPVPMVGPNGERTKGSVFRAAFQAGEKVSIQGTVASSALKKGATLIIEKAPVTPKGTVGRFVRTHTITPDEFGKYAQDIPVREGLEVVRHRLLVKKTTVKKPDINWAALEARAEAILAADEMKALEALKVKLVAAAKKAAEVELTKAEAALLKKLKVALKNEVKSFVVGNMNVVGTTMMTVNLIGQQKRDVTLYMSGYPQNGCNPATTQNCETTQFDVQLNSGQTRTVQFVFPTEKNTLSFYGYEDGHGTSNLRTYTPNWSSATDATPCANNSKGKGGISPSPSQLLEFGSTWDITLQGDVSMEGYMMSPVADSTWGNQLSKKQGDGKVPPGCGFEFDRAIGTWWTNAPEWETLLIEAVAAVGVSMLTFGAADAAFAAQAAVDAAEAADAMFEAADAAADALGDAADDLAGSDLPAETFDQQTENIGRQLESKGVEFGEEGFLREDKDFVTLVDDEGEEFRQFTRRGVMRMGVAAQVIYGQSLAEVGSAAAAALETVSDVAVEGLAEDLSSSVLDSFGSFLSSATDIAEADAASVAESLDEESIEFLSSFAEDESVAFLEQGVDYEFLLAVLDSDLADLGMEIIQAQWEGAGAIVW